MDGPSPSTVTATAATMGTHEEEQRQPYLRTESPHLPRALAQHSAICFLTESVSRASFEANHNVRTTHSPHSTKVSTPNIAQFDPDQIIWIKPSDQRRQRQELDETSTGSTSTLYPVPPALLYIEVARWAESGGSYISDSDHVNEFIQTHLQPRMMWFRNVVQSAPNRRTFMNRLRPCMQEIFGKRDFQWPIPHGIASSMFQPKTAETDQLSSLQSLLDQPPAPPAPLRPPSSPPRDRPMRRPFVYWHLPKSESPPPTSASAFADDEEVGSLEAPAEHPPTSQLLRQSLVRADRNLWIARSNPNREIASPTEFAGPVPEPGTFSSDPQQQKASLDRSFPHHSQSNSNPNPTETKETMGPKISNEKITREEEEEESTQMEVDEEEESDSGSGSGSDSGSGSESETEETIEERTVVADDALTSFVFGGGDPAADPDPDPEPEPEPAPAPAPAPTPAPKTSNAAKNLILNMKKKTDEAKAAATPAPEPVVVSPASAPVTPKSSGSNKKKTPAPKTPQEKKTAGSKRKAPEPATEEEKEEETETTEAPEEPPAKKKKTSATTSTPTKKRSNPKTKATPAPAPAPANGTNHTEDTNGSGSSHRPTMSETLKFIEENSESIEEHREEFRNLYDSFVQRVHGMTPETRYKKIKDYMLSHFKNASPDVIRGARWMMRLLTNYGMYLPLEAEQPYPPGKPVTSQNKQDAIDLGLMMVYFGQAPNTTDECYDAQEYREAWEAEEAENRRLQEEKEAEELKKKLAKAAPPPVKKPPKTIDLSDMPDPFA